MSLLAKVRSLRSERARGLHGRGSRDRGSRGRSPAIVAATVSAVVALLAGCSASPSATPTGTSDASAAASATASPGERLAAAPMGWNSWNHFGCDVTEADVKGAADAIASDGLREAGYDYVTVDDCWQAHTRDAAGALRANPTRFPDGMAALAAYVHSKGLLFGVYAAPGAMTCAERYQDYPGRLGSLGHVQQDADTFASWGVDYLKYDWCAADREGVGHEQAFAEMRAALNETGRRIVLSIHDKPEQPTPGWRHWVSDLSRTTVDIRDDWASVLANAEATIGVHSFAAQGHFNDPDMLEVGNGGLSPAEERSHLALWAQLSAPLIIGCDLRTASKSSLAVLGNRSVIAIDQDALGAQVHRVRGPAGTLVLTKALSGGGVAVSVTNLSGARVRASLSTATLGLDSRRLGGTELFTGRRVQAGDRLAVDLLAHDTALFRLTTAG
jgi:alpha-galactosidase